MKKTYPFKLEPLPYAYDALEPYIDQRTMRIHHDKHLGAYVDKLNAALKDYPQFHDWSLEQLLYYSDRLPDSIRDQVLKNGGGVYNHNFFFDNLAPGVEDNQPQGTLEAAINKQFGSFDAFKTEFKKNALADKGIEHVAMREVMTLLAVIEFCLVKIYSIFNML